MLIFSQKLARGPEVNIPIPGSVSDRLPIVKISDWVIQRRRPTSAAAPCDWWNPRRRILCRIFGRSGPCSDILRRSRVQRLKTADFLRRNWHYRFSRRHIISLIVTSTSGEQISTANRREGQFTLNGILHVWSSMPKYFSGARLTIRVARVKLIIVQKMYSLFMDSSSRDFHAQTVFDLLFWSFMCGNLYSSYFVFGQSCLL